MHVLARYLVQLFFATDRDNIAENDWYKNNRNLLIFTDYGCFGSRVLNFFVVIHILECEGGDMFGWLQRRKMYLSEEAM
jgi:hypothetical protein